MPVRRRLVTGRAARRAAAVVTAVCLGAMTASCTVESADKGTPSNSGGPAVAAGIAPGITADSVKLGIVYPDLAAVKQFINADYGDYEATFKALIDEINKAGGINGRKITPVFGKVNPISATSMQEACVKLTQDEHVFAVTGSITSPEQATCYVQTQKTALVGGLLSDAAYADAQAPWFSTERGADGSAESVRALIAHGDLTNRRIAVVGIATDQVAIDTGVTPALKAGGITPVASGILTTTNDPAALGQQMGVLLQKFQSAGTDTVVVVGGAAAIFPPALEKAPWRPRLAFAVDPGVYLADKSKHDFGTLKDAVLALPRTDWNDPALQKCAKTVEAANPALAGKLTDPATAAAGQPTPGVSVQIACSTLALFRAIAERAGKNLDYASFQTAGQNLGTLHVPGYVDDATYGPKTPHGALPYRVSVFDPAAQRFVPASS